MKSRLPFLIPLALFAALVIWFAVGLTLDPRNIPSAMIGKPLPEFELAGLHEGEAGLDTAYFQDGKPRLLNLFASWCVPCRVEHPVITEIAQRHGVEVVAIAYKDTREEAIKWLARHGNPYARVAEDGPGRIGIELGVAGVPETFLIDGDGIIRHKKVGPMTRLDVENTILPLIAEIESTGS